ncbi:MAG: Eco57I restriction-modification methylase domain-containing protein [Hyphomonas sp.]
MKSAYYHDGDDGQLETLPNIDINIKCGNSLLSRFQLNQNLSDAFNRAKLTVGEYRELVATYKHTKDKAIKRQIHDRIKKAKSRFQEESLDRITKQIAADIAKLKADEAQADLFVFDKGNDAEREARLEDIRKKIADLEARRDKLKQDKTFMSALEWRFEFPEVLDDKGRYVGFDIIIANPPYMRIQEIEATQSDQREFYERDYRTARGSYDIANLFFELAVRLSKPEGDNNIFIFPHKLFNSANGAPLREYLMNTRAMKHITHFGANQIFDGVLTYTCIALFNSAPSNTFQFKRFKLGENVSKELGNDELYADLSYRDISSASDAYGDNQWIFFDQPEGFECFQKIYKGNLPFSEMLSAFVGLQTSRDSLYVVKKLGESESTYTILVNPSEKIEKVPIATRTFEVEKTLFKPFLMGKDVHRYDTLETDRLVFFPYIVEQHGASLVAISTLKSSYPKTFDFVMAYEAPFKRRENGKAETLAEWYAYIYEKNLDKFDQPKLTSMEICSNHSNITLNPSDIYHSTTVYSFIPKLAWDRPYEFYLAVLNSNVFWWFLKHTGDTLQGDARRIKTNYINPFPLPISTSKDDVEHVVALVREIVVEKEGQARPEETQRLEKAINTAVYKLYGLYIVDIEVVERAIA